MSLLHPLIVGAFFLPPLLIGATVDVRIAPGSGFTPNKVQIQQGDTVLFRNDTQKQHDVTADPALAKNPANVILPAGAEPFHSKRLESGESFSHEFTVPGLYQYVCTIHEQFGMMGQIEVLP